MIRKTMLWLLVCVAIALNQQPVAAQGKQPFKPLTVETPVRPAGQQDVIGLTAPKLDVVRVGFIGLHLLLSR